jgi:hypothetical protein
VRCPLFKAAVLIFMSMEGGDKKGCFQLHSALWGRRGKLLSEVLYNAANNAEILIKGHAPDTNNGFYQVLIKCHSLVWTFYVFISLHDNPVRRSNYYSHFIDKVTEGCWRILQLVVIQLICSGGKTQSRCLTIGLEYLSVSASNVYSWNIYKSRGIN